MAATCPALTVCAAVISQFLFLRIGVFICQVAADGFVCGEGWDDPILLQFLNAVGNISRYANSTSHVWVLSYLLGSYLVTCLVSIHSQHINNNESVPVAGGFRAAQAGHEEQRHNRAITGSVATASMVTAAS